MDFEINNLASKLILSQNELSRNIKHPWKRKRITPKQHTFLESYLSKSNIKLIDRGTGALLIQHIIDESREAQAWCFANFPEEDFVQFD
jgi:hypothetical protein